MGVQAELMIQAAEQLKSEIIAYRRALHQQPEVGAYLPNTKEFVKKALSEMGYAPIEICESGIVATITGKNTGRCILLRADMDALARTDRFTISLRKRQDACMRPRYAHLNVARSCQTAQNISIRTQGNC